ncbi:MAG TPA: diaminopimelate epimerase [Bacteroidetes bacterium]|nr:diaminopimelate epimerase [Bacteroidota bacterium]
MKLQYIKCNGSGNDFVMIDGVSQKLTLKEKDYSNISRLLCDRQNGVGADGVLFLLPSKIADARMRIFNDDGSEPEMCGNGIRCIARRAIELLDKKKLYIQTMKSVMEVKKEQDIFKNVSSFSVVIPDIEIKYNQKLSVVDEYIPDLSSGYKFTTINTGNPHILSKVEDIDKVVLEEIGIKANNLPDTFDQGVNVSFFKILDDNSIYVSTYERGVGLTSSCGTAMSASSLVSALLNLTSFNKWFNIYNDGGMVKCLPMKIATGFSVKLLGNAMYEFEGEFIYDDSKNELNGFTKINNETNENLYNQKFQTYCKNYL